MLLSLLGCQILGCHLLDDGVIETTCEQTPLGCSADRGGDSVAPDSGDTGPVPEDEDCGDGADNDLDGLIDCEDSDCVDVCLEVCDDGLDNDSDGDVDCEDDECFGADGCPPGYDLSMEVSLSTAAAIWGSYMESYLGVYDLAVLWGEIQLTGSPWDTADPGFYCEGRLFAYPFDIGLGYEALRYDPGECGGCDKRFFFTPLASNRSLYWYGDCPIDALPPTWIGFHIGSPELSRYGAGGWITQYTTAGVKTYYDSGFIDGYSYYRWWMEDMNPVQPVTWTGAYEVAR